MALRQLSLFGAAPLLAAIGFALAQRGPSSTNLAATAETTTSYVSPHEKLSAVNDGYEPRGSWDRGTAAYGNWPRTGTQWVEYRWPKPIATNRIEVYWFDDRGGVRLPASCRLLAWIDGEWRPVPGAESVGVLGDRFNVVEFSEIRTDRLRLEFRSSGEASTGILEWRVLDSGNSPNFVPKVEAGPERTVVLGGRTYPTPKVLDDGKPSGRLLVRWEKASGPGKATFASVAKADTSATFDRPGVYLLRLTADDGEERAADTVRVHVVPAPTGPWLERPRAAGWSVGGPFWGPRYRAILTRWLPYLIEKYNDPKLPEGGIRNFEEVGKKLRGQPHESHMGPPFADAFIYDALESLCLALLLDPKGDPEIRAAQRLFSRTVEDWIPKILSAQSPDGYIQNFETNSGSPRWSNVHNHEAFNLGHLIEAAMAHFEATGRKDRRLLDAAIRAADCWDRNIGPAPKRHFHVEHQGLEQALIRLGRLVDELKGPGQGRRYRQLALYFLDERGGGNEYDQSHLPVRKQYEAVGHAVRAVYQYQGMVEAFQDARDVDLLSAALSLEDSIVHRKYYLTGGIGSGETSEGFGADYSLPNNSYCESCAGCGQLFFEYALLRTTGEARHADLFEETLMNNVLGAIDLAGENYTYTNALDSSHGRYKWHVCPCCVGNVPRTLLQLPQWAYAKAPDGLFVNLYFEGSADLGQVAGVRTRVTQKTDYPWKGSVKLTLEPERAVRLVLRLREPNRQTSALYRNQPEVAGLGPIRVNGQAVRTKAAKGYRVVERVWRKGDTVEFTVPLRPQRVSCDPRVKANVGRVALRYGPLVYNFESVDQALDRPLSPTAPIEAVWTPELLGGIVTLRTRFADGSPAVAVPNYARLNRGGRSVVWMPAP